jgi:hypothetical protein
MPSPYWKDLYDQAVLEPHPDKVLERVQIHQYRMEKARWLSAEEREEINMRWRLSSFSWNEGLRSKYVENAISCAVRFLMGNTEPPALLGLRFSGPVLISDAVFVPK